MLNPAVQRRVIDTDAPLLQHFLKAPVADAVFAIPTNAPENDLTPEMPPFEIVHARSASSSKPPDPHRAGFCNRADDASFQQ